MCICICQWQLAPSYKEFSISLQLLWFQALRPKAQAGLFETWIHFFLLNKFSDEGTVAGYNYWRSRIIMYERKCHCRFDQGLSVHCLPGHGILHRETVLDHFAQMEANSRSKQGHFASLPDCGGRFGLKYLMRILRTHSIIIKMRLFWSLWWSFSASSASWQRKCEVEFDAWQGRRRNH